MTDRVQVDQLQPGTTFRRIVDLRVEGTDELVPATDTLTAFEVAPNGTMIEIQTEVGTLVRPGGLRGHGDRRQLSGGIRRTDVRHLASVKPIGGGGSISAPCEPEPM